MDRSQICPICANEADLAQIVHRRRQRFASISRLDHSIALALGLHFEPGNMEDVIDMEHGMGGITGVRKQPGAAQYANLIQRGNLSRLNAVPFHGKEASPISRLLFANDGADRLLSQHIVAHEVTNVPEKDREYCELHIHDCDELNILVSPSELLYEICLGDEVYEVNAPACIYVPAGLPHRANVIKGTGFYIAIVDTQNYNSSVSEPDGDQ